MDESRRRIRAPDFVARGSACLGLLGGLACAPAPTPGISAPSEVRLRPWDTAPCVGLSEPRHRQIVGSYHSAAYAKDTWFYAASDHILVRDTSTRTLFLEGDTREIVWAGDALWVASGRHGVQHLPDGRQEGMTRLDTTGEIVSITASGTHVWAAGRAGQIYRWPVDRPQAVDTFSVDGVPQQVVAHHNQLLVLDREGFVSQIPTPLRRTHASAATGTPSGVVLAHDRTVYTHPPTELDAPVQAMAWWKDGLVVATSNSLERIDEGKTTTLAPALPSKVSALVAGDSLQAMAGDGGAFTLQQGQWTPTLPGGVITRAYAEADDLLFAIESSSSPRLIRRGRNLALPSGATDLLRRHDHWLVGTLEHGVLRLEADDTLLPWALPAEPIVALDGDARGPWSALTHGKGVHHMVGRESMHTVTPPLSVPAGDLLRWGEHHTLLYLIASRMDRITPDGLQHIEPMGSTVLSMLSPVYPGHPRRDGDEAWVALPTWGMLHTTDAGRHWTHHRLHPGVWDTAPATQGRYVALGAAGVGRLDEGLVARCAAPGVTRNLLRRGERLYGISSGVVTTWEIAPAQP